MGKKYLCVLLLLLLNFCGFSQLTVTSNSVANTLAQNIVGNGLTPTNAVLNCPNGAAGTFTCSIGALGLPNGIILTTGTASAAAAASSTFASTGWGTTSSDPALTSVMGTSGSINDACILTFDFVPLCNTVDIKFVFGSEEYPGFVGSINDGFGIFLSGPNPGGGTYTNHNFAVLPNGTAITINNVNSTSNSTYYHNNASGAMSNYLAYGGYTSAVTASVAVTPCQSYHMEVAIADASDDIYDSGVLIQANSVSCTNTPTLTASATPASCGTLGSATATVSNYTGTPTYTWSPGNAHTASINNLTPGTYTCSIGLNLGCGVTTQTVTAVVTSTGASFSFTPTHQNPSCNNGTNGTAGVTVTNGTAPYTYTWTTTPVQNTPTATNLSAGAYVVNVTDNTGCIGTTTITLTNPAAITATVNTTPTTCTASIGSATVTASGSAPYTYTWSNSGHTQNITNLSQGSYSVVVTDANTCTVSATGTVGVQSFSWTPSANGTNPKCPGNSDGTATVTINNPGTSGPFGCIWTPSAQTGTVAINLPAGSYTVAVTDNNGCQSLAVTTLTNPLAITATVTTSPTTCTASIGTASVTSSGLAPYTYTWSNSGNTQNIANLSQGPYSVVLTDANTCTATATGTVGIQSFSWTASASGTNPKCTGNSDGTATVTINNPGTSTFSYTWMPTAQTNPVATGLPSGSYIVQIADNNGCTSTATTTLTDPPPLTATVTTAPTICTGSVGSASVVTSGLAPSTYTWVTSPIQTTPTAINLPQGAVSVFAADANGCPVVGTGTVLSTGFTWTPNISTSPTKCFGSADGTATATINNSSAGNTYSYTWTPTGETDSIATGFSAQNCTVTVEDNNNCIATATATITQPTQLVASTQTSRAICMAANGIAYVSSIGGTLPYSSYSWSITNPVQTTQTATGLMQGQYTVTVTDANGCHVSAIAIVGDTADLTVTASQSPDLCYKGVGKATANPVGQSPYRYIWSTTPVDTLQTADSLTVGTYSVNVIDAYGCTASAVTTVVNQNDVLASQFYTTPQGEIDAENETNLNISANSGWSVTSAYLTDSASTINVPISSNPFSYVFPKYGNYTAIYYYISVNGCKDTVTELITVKDYMTVYIPNSFTPNGDGFNETFSAAGSFINKFEMYIYDRWGVLVIRLDDINKGWDGTENGGPAQEDTYVYKGSAYDIFGKHISFNGQVTLIR